MSLTRVFTSSAPRVVGREALITDATEDFIHEMSRQQPWLRARYELLLGDLAAALTETVKRPAPLTSLTPARAQAWLSGVTAEQRPLAQQVLEAFAAYLVKWGWLPAHPLRQNEPV